MRDEEHLRPRPANFNPLTPLDFLDHAVNSLPTKTAVVWRDRSWTWSEFHQIVLRLAKALKDRGIQKGDVVSIMCPNRPEMLAAHYAIPALGAVLNSVNTRIEAKDVAFILKHAESRLILADPTCADDARKAAQETGVPIEVFAEDGESGDGLKLLSGERPPEIDLIAEITDEWQPIALNYTSGTTGNPKGVVLHHRGAWLNAVGNITALQFNDKTAYLWTLPMFHCNGWCHTWSITAAGGTHVCLDKVVPEAVFEAMDRIGVTHLSCAPVVLYMLINSDAKEKRDASRRITVATGGAAPTASLIKQMDALGFDFIHLYGLTECYGPTSIRELNEHEAGLDVEERANLLARQGVRHLSANRIRVVNDEGAEVPADGTTVGEIVLTGNTLLAGYYRNPDETEKAFAGGGFHTGDLAVRHPDGHIEIKDRAKDVIITGGENVSSLEVEDVLSKHPDVAIAAVVAKPDEKWGEIPMAFIEAKSGTSPQPETLETFCREHLPGFKIPRAWAFCELPKTATGKIQKYVLREQAAEKAAGANG
ncbi:acyl-CoA synthase [Fulvimarina pelagi HTCC2506]|uniref:3-methylmercaptopropionyl-CoA ligase n=1 Tax=Fulvimarina pelagi HTCC2506 TaxID=314231 RepID=Q0G5H5_9HYPH|nr:AMP-binding protein [Fulvimarina pelagi]EAU43089.1 acyl-CoA synthase [Fulvimarina pelagi HTCC2506]